VVAGLGIPFVLVAFLGLPIALAALGLRRLRRDVRAAVDQDAADEG
jgi:hypothetical protein